LQACGPVSPGRTFFQQGDNIVLSEDRSPSHVKVMTKALGLKQRVLARVVACALVATCVPGVCGAQQDLLPHLRKQGTATQLVVDGKPFLIRGGELGNSTSSSLEYMRSLWPKLAALKLNTVVIPFYWELIEPVEGKYDFSLVDGLIREARQHQLRLAPGKFDIQRIKLYRYG
jgi:hypothetical protein